MSEATVKETVRKGLVIHISPEGPYFVIKVDDHPELRMIHKGTKREALGEFLLKHHQFLSIERIQA